MKRAGEIIVNLASFRLMLAAAILGVIVAVVLNLLWAPLAYLGVPVALLAWIGAAMNPETTLYCAHCRKRVKAGATTCHHCGQTASV